VCNGVEANVKRGAHRRVFLDPLTPDLLKVGHRAKTGKAYTNSVKCR